MMNAMIEAQEITRETGQVLTVFTVDQQLYRVIVNVKWVYTELFHSFIRRLACLTSFVGCVCVLMANSVLRVRGISMSDAISHFISSFLIRWNVSWCIQWVSILGCSQVKSGECHVLSKTILG